MRAYVRLACAERMMLPCTPGNFCTTMFNELCRVGTLLTLQLTPPAGAAAEGAPWDWQLPTWHWLYNEAHVLLRPAFAPSRTLRYLARDGGDDAAAPRCEDAAALLGARKRALLQFTRDHVLGGAAPRKTPRVRF